MLFPRPLFKSEAKWKKYIYFLLFIANKTHVHKKGFAFSLDFKVRVFLRNNF